MNSRELRKRVDVAQGDIQLLIGELTSIDASLPKRLKFFSANTTPIGSPIDLLKNVSGTAQQVGLIIADWERIVGDLPPLPEQEQDDDHKIRPIGRTLDD